MRKVAFIVPPGVEILGLAGPVQVFTEAKCNGLEIELEFYSYQQGLMSNSGLPFGNIANYMEANLTEGDYIFIPGMDFNYVNSMDFRAEKDFFNWLKDSCEKKIFISSICNGAFALGEAGLLKNRECTTHWKSVPEFQKRFPSAKVLTDILYKKCGYIYTSAGYSSGLDLALSILEELSGAYFTHKVARGLVVYNWRKDDHSQQSVYLDFRNHNNLRIHKIQDYLINHLSAQNSIEDLASIVAMSPRNLSRVFKEKTGTTIVEYLTLLRIEFANMMSNNPELTIENIAFQCGFKTVRQLRRILKNDKIPVVKYQ